MRCFAIQRSPALVVQEETHTADLLRRREIEAVIHLRRNDDQIAGVDVDAHPAVARVANVEDASTFDDEADLVERVEVLLVELRADFVEVGSLFRERDFILLAITSIALDAGHLGGSRSDRHAFVENAELAQLISGERMSRLIEKKGFHRSL